MTKRLSIDDDSPLPVYAQLSEQMLGAVARGELKLGERLPSVREVASSVGVNPNTVNRAYAELERIGVLETRRGRGTFVAARHARRGLPGAPRLTDLAEPFVARARSLGYAGTHIISTVASIVRRSR